MSKIHKVSEGKYPIYEGNGITVIVHRTDGRRHLAYFFFDMEGDRHPCFCAFGTDITPHVWGWEYV